MSASRSQATQAELDRIRRAYVRYSSEPTEVGRRDPGNPGNRMLKEEWRGRLRVRLDQTGIALAEARILDAGCGDGELIAWLAAEGASPERCVGVDLMPERVQAAAARLSEATFVCSDFSDFSAADDSFDIVCMSMLLSSVLSDELAEQLCAEARRVLSPEGVVVLYDTRYPNPLNPDVRAIRRRHIGVLFPGFRLELEPISLLPPLARALGRTAPRLYPVLAALSPLRARYLGLLFPASAEATP